jgi:Sec-independent protein translocase protein TatA
MCAPVIATASTAKREAIQHMWTWLLIIFVAILVIKPERLPEIAYFLGRTIARLRFLYQSFLKEFPH